MTTTETAEGGRPMWHSLPITDIRVGERFREELGEIEKLKESIATYGLFHPVVIDRNFSLLAGFRRLSACRALNHTTIYCRFIDEVDELTAREIELEENLARKNLTWLEETRLRAEIDKLKKLKYGAADAGRYSAEGGGWSMRDTAVALNVDVSTVSRAVARMEAITWVPTIAEAQSAKAADREIDRLAQEIETELNLRRRKAEAAALTTDLHHGDCLEVLRTLKAGSVDCIITDPPYGLDLDIITDSNHRTHTEYIDTPEVIAALLKDAFKEMHRVLRDVGHTYVFSSSNPKHQVLAITLLEQAGFIVEPIPLIWVKDSHSTVDWDKRFAHSYESILFCSNRSRNLDHKRINVFTYNNDPNRVHTAQKPIALLTELIGMSTAVGELVLDPFMGSGSTCVAAARTGRRFVGIEIGKAIFDAAKLRVMNEVQSVQQATP